MKKRIRIKRGEFYLSQESQSLGSPDWVSALLFYTLSVDFYKTTSSIAQ